jgi:hypothetical protein
MIFSSRTLALACALLLAACGGGGGGSGSSSSVASGPQAVVISESNAKPVSASALDTAQNTSTTSNIGGLPIAVQVDPSAAPSSLQLITQAVRLATGSFSATGLPAGVLVSETGNCSFGGTVSISGHVANASTLTAGDTLVISMNSCSEASGMSLNGQLAMTVASVSGSLSAVPFHIVLSTTATNLSATSNGVTVVANGSITLDWTATSASDTFVASGTAMSTRETVSGSSHTTTLRNFTQTQIVSGSTLTGSLTATVESDSPRLGGAVSYTVTTPTPVVWNAGTRTATSGVIKVVGANNSQLLATINADGSVTIQLDANGDGVYEKTISSTTAELAGLV